MKERCFSDWDDICTTLDLNSHLPKPKAEESKDKKEEAKDEKEGDKEKEPEEKDIEQEKVIGWIYGKLKKYVTVRIFESIFLILSIYCNIKNTAVCRLSSRLYKIKVYTQRLNNTE